MALVVSDSGNPQQVLEQGWELLLTAAGACASPSDADTLTDWLPAIVPGTVAQALEAQGRWSREAPEPLHGSDVWYRLSLAMQGPQTLVLEGLATHAEIFVNGGMRLESTSMYHRHQLTLEGPAVLHIAFRSLTQAMTKKLPRARWRVRMIPDQALRGQRTTLLGHVPGWAPAFDHIGPYRPVTLQAENPVQDVRLLARLEGDAGVLTCFLPDPGWDGEITLHCAGCVLPMTRRNGRLMGRLTLPDVPKWWPHTHGAPALHEVVLMAGSRRLSLGRVGFRSVTIDRGADGKGFGLIVNGVPVFCRGASWTPPDPVGLSSGEAMMRSLDLAADAHVNMLRVSGVTLYESDAFYRRCDELGIMVWQDFAFANFDHPMADAGFAASVAQEVAQFLDRIQASPSLVVLCGGSEVAQQAAMLGLPPKFWTSELTQKILPEAVREWRPDALYVENSPSGGELPFSTNEGVTHYYGVGAYCRPLEDARRAEVRFAAECLAFANVPSARTLDATGLGQSGHDGRWKAGVPRDIGASWDFEDVREHYMRLLYGVDPARLRHEDDGRYLDLSRATVAEVMQETFAEWRRPGSPTRGALVWLWQDMKEGAGWGVIDHLGQPKSAFHALRRAFRPVQLVLSDEGLNGLMLHALNETAEPIEATVLLACLRDGAMPAVRGEAEITIPARGHVSLSSTQLFGAFFDATYAYRFGPPAHDVTVARMQAVDEIIEAFHFPQGRGLTRHDLGLTVAVVQDHAGYALRLESQRLAQSVSIRDEHFRAEEEWFHLSPGVARLVKLISTGPSQAKPHGEVTALNGLSPVAYAA